MKKSILRNEQGFTLIEIISVLVILGILAAVATPKFMNLQEDARVQAANAAIAEVQARLSIGYGQYILRSGGTVPPQVRRICTHTVGGVVFGVNDTTVLPTNCNGTVPELGDFVAGLTRTDTVATITVSQVNGVALAANATGTWTLPTAP